MEQLTQSLKRTRFSREKSSSDDRKAELLEWQQRRANKANRTPGSLSGYDCKQCLNRGYSMAVRDGELVAVGCRCMATRRSIAILKKSGLESMIERCTFDRFETREDWQSKAKEKAQQFAQNPEGWLIACGQSGSGKTHLCVAVCRELMLRGMETRYMLWRDEVTKLKALSTESEAYQRVIEPLKSVPVLYVDDFLKVGRNETPTTADLNIAFELLNSRYINLGAITVISTERRLDELRALDEALAGRIYERSKGSILTLVGEGKNWRLKP